MRRVGRPHCILVDAYDSGYWGKLEHGAKGGASSTGGTYQVRALVGTIGG